MIQSRALVSGDNSGGGNHAMMRRLQMPAVGNIIPGNRLTEPIGQNDEREPDDDRKFSLAFFTS